MERLSRILNVLLVVCSISVPTSLVLALYFFYQHTEIMQVKNKLLSKSELQAELLKSQESNLALLPHIDREIGYVLNPSMKRSTWRAAEGGFYPINALGLRGPEIRPKEEGVTRILLVGDSMVFGYQLPEEEKLSQILNEYTSQRPDGGKRVEFVTVALPGWNVRSETAFLERHIRLLDPDAIFWWIIDNDIEDVAGAVPPGMLALWASPQAEYQSPFGGISEYHKKSARIMPALAKRYQDNWELIAGFHARYSTPIILMDVANAPASDSFNPPRIYRPRIYAADKRWALSPTDAHPSGWANHVIAIGILRKLVQLGIIPEIEFTPEDRVIVQNYEDEEARRSAERDTGPSGLSDQEVWSWLLWTPTQIDGSEVKDSKGVLYGIGQDGAMARAGTLYLQAPANSSQAVLHIALPPGMEKYPGTATFSIRNLIREERQTSVTMNAKKAVVTLAIPGSPDDVPLYEISWLFDYSHCQGPSECSSGTLQSAGFTE